MTSLYIRTAGILMTKSTITSGKEVLIPALKESERADMICDSIADIGASLWKAAFSELVRREGITKDFLASHLRLNHERTGP